jgi:hypothetical protein
MRSRYPQFARSLLSLIILLPLCANAQPHAAWRVSLEPLRPVNGSPVLFRVTPPAALTSLQATWLGHKLRFRFSKKCSCWYALGGVELSTKPGKYPLHLEGDSATPRSIAFSHDVLVRAAHYPSTALKVAPGFVEPPKEIQPRLEEEAALKKRVFAETAPESVWSGSFVAPTQTEPTGVFGAGRVFNGKLRNQHQGLDFHASAGTPVHATNSGKVLLARGLYFEGNCVALDHGDGLITFYMHLSEFRVKEGEAVEKGQLLGLSGGTGRATAPHLHFGVRWQGAYLDPATLLKLHAP